MPDDVNFVVIFHAFTGLQCRVRDYLYLLACIVLPRDRCPLPKEGFVGSSSDFVDLHITQRTI